jgi:NADPH2:quinone reductase
MKAIWLNRFGASHASFELRETPAPAPPAGHIRVTTEASGLNFADVMARLGLYQDAPPLPFVPGYEVVGRVDAVGENVTHLREGQRVLAFTRFGGYASSAVASADVAVPVSENDDAAELTWLATQASTAYYSAHELVRLQSGDHVLVQAGAGGVGSALVQMAKHAGCVVYATAGDAKLDVLKRLGVDHPIAYRQVDFAAEFLRQSGGRRADVIFDSLGGRAVRKGIALLASGGRIVCLGASEMAGRRASILRTARVAVQFGLLHPIQLMIRSKSILGVNMLRIADERPDILVRAMKAVVAMYEKGDLRPIGGRVFAAEEIAQAHEFLASRESIGKVAISWSKARA